MLLEPALIELRVIEAAKLWSQAAEGSNQSELTCDEIAHEIEPHFSRELQPVVSLALHLTSSGSPPARRFAIMLLELKAAKVRSPLSFAALKARRFQMRPPFKCRVQGMM